jgi:hypothetical protein
VVGGLLAHGSEQQPREPTSTSGAHDEHFRSSGLLDKHRGCAALAHNHFMGHARMVREDVGSLLGGLLASRLFELIRKGWRGHHESACVRRDLYLPGRHDAQGLTVDVRLFCSESKSPGRTFRTVYPDNDHAPHRGRRQHRP